MTSAEIDMQNALDNVLSEFKVKGKIENKIHIEFIRDAYKHVSGSMMRNYARAIGGDSFVNAIDQILNN